MRCHVWSHSCASLKTHVPHLHRFTMACKQLMLISFSISDILPAVLCLMGDKCWSSASTSYLSRERGIYHSDKELLLAMWRHITTGLYWAKSLKLSFCTFRKRKILAPFFRGRLFWLYRRVRNYENWLKLSNVCPPTYLSAPNSAIHIKYIIVRTYNWDFC